MDEKITIVSGLPRSGTSMMMKMLESGGLPILIDNIRTPDEDNPLGYYEFERVKQIDTDQAWLQDARGHVVKMVGALLRKLPAQYDYRIVFMRRSIEEVLASQRQMLIRRGEDTDRVGDEVMAALFARHVEEITEWIEAQPNMAVLYVNYGDVLTQPQAEADRINAFLGSCLDSQRMAATVDPQLYRQRREG